MILGDLLIVIASAIVSFQMVYEQKFITKYDVPPLFAVGLEGMDGSASTQKIQNAPLLGLFGAAIFCILLVVMFFIRVPPPFSHDPEGRLENILDAFDQIRANMKILALLIGKSG